jgi:hypothetical protein
LIGDPQISHNQERRALHSCDLLAVRTGLVDASVAGFIGDVNVRYKDSGSALVISPMYPPAEDSITRARDRLLAVDFDKAVHQFACKLDVRRYL